MDAATLDLQALRASRRAREQGNRAAVDGARARSAAERGDDGRLRFATLCRSVAAGDSHAPGRGRHWLRPDW